VRIIAATNADVATAVWSLGIFLAGVFVGALVDDLLKCLSGNWFWYLWAVVSTSALLWSVTAVWDKAPGIAQSTAVERDGIGLVCILGAIGGLVRWLNELFKSSAQNPRLDSFLWLLESAALSLIVVLLLRAGVVSPSVSDGAKAINWLNLYAIAGLIGLFANEVVEKLAAVFSVIFSSSPGST
jgi:hypothetical protein